MKTDFNPVDFFRDADTLSRECLGREFRATFKKGELTLQCEEKIKNCLKEKHKNLFGSEFLKRWISNWIYYYHADIFMNVYNKCKDSQLSTVYANAVFGTLTKHLNLP